MGASAVLESWTTFISVACVDSGGQSLASWIEEEEREVKNVLAK